MQGPLSSLKVLDFSTLLPGPCATMMLADMGAEVVRIESPVRLDMLRVLPPMVGKVSASHAYLNRSKLSLALDLKKDGAADIVRRLLLTHDILLEQFRPGVMQRLGLGYEALKEVNPRLIYCSLTGYGQTGPLAQKAGHDINYLALAGVSSCSGRQASGPSPLGIQVADVAGGSHHAVMGILAAVIERQQTGRGQYIDISMSDAALTLNHMAMAGFLSGGALPDAESDILNGGSCYDYYATEDGRYLSMGALEPQFVQGLCQALGLVNMASRMLSMRADDRAHCKAMLAATFASHPLSYWQDQLANLDICVEPVLTLEEARAHPHFNARKMFCEVTLPDGLLNTQLASPIRFSGHHNRQLKSGGLPGAESREVLLAAGYSEAEIAAMAATGLFGKAF
jgi:alpha-methylacyl-CoA racemase